ncbi:NAD(P)/FAD-dependent oxidoreductase [Bradyrhizobium sp. 45]|uniref:flavin-containing monooxygenase n=1 Tax=Bradyrhizobium sp. 45 TaxID=1043587 RepID=UPI001FFBB9D4|nr:NAD(P)/FAD-dependent oxidoreductase [Bradyrhizobium sp. 45]MCK1306397.1 NAD(P)/FAD-dependent oxidoreductase [Bradyrhizobium sp. 45]
MAQDHFDVLIVGAGLSGIGAGFHLQTKCPGKSYVILEGRDCIGGTWDLFRYPGVRSDSDMFTLGYSFKPWTDPKAIADGAQILNYVRETAAENGIEKHIRFRHHVKRAAWSTSEARWTVEAERITGEGGAETVRLTCNFLFMCSGYYKYEAGYMPEFPGVADFAGRIVHPQKWTDDIDCAGKRVVVIGSGATAVTLVPELAKTAVQVTMLQRSPTYVVSRPAQDPVANKLRRNLPTRLAYHLIRWRNVMWGMFFFQLSRRRPAKVKELVLKGVQMALGPDYDVATHFTPRYNPWDQRLCLVPDGGGLDISVDGRAVDFANTLTYKGMMYADVPNMASAFGYTNASWTLKCDLTCEYVCRLINYMDRHNFRQYMPHNDDPTITAQPSLDFTSGYVQRSVAKMPKQGSKQPWRLYQNYALDIVSLRFGRIDDGVMQYS